MEKVRNSILWMEEGYNLFAHEGCEGLRVEKIARKLRLNKSAFYHYFDDLDGFCKELIQMHYAKAGLFLRGIGELKNLDPEYLLLIIAHKSTVMFQIQLRRNPKNQQFYEASRIVDLKVNLALRQLWSAYLGVNCDTELTIRYYCVVRDKLYARAGFHNLEYQFLRDIVSEAKSILDQWRRLKPSTRAGAISPVSRRDRLIF